MKKLLPLSYCIIVMFPVCLGAQDVDETQMLAETGKPEASTRKPYQITITPTLSRTGLRELIAGVEEDFYRKFNELNIEDDYDIACYKHTPTGSHIWRRVCEPIFMLKYRGDMASSATFFLGAGDGAISARASAADYMLSERQLLRRRREEYKILQDLMEEFTRDDSEFRQIGEVLAELKSRLDNYGRDD